MIKSLSQVRGRDLALLAFGILALTVAGPAHAAGLDKAATFLTTLRDQVKIIVPIVAVLSMLIIGIMYSNGMMRKETMVHWFIGLVLAGSATEIVALFFA